MLFCLCFFFKQKTAYEMRISDWSSDVCSSDLRAEPVDQIGHRLFVQRAAFKLELAGNERFHHWHRQADQVEAETGVKRVGKRFHPFAEQAGQQGGDRKSVVKGKSVSVGVDLGGRRIIKQKQHNNNEKKY